MKTIKEIVVIILCFISVSCVSHKDMTGNNHRSVYNIHGIKIRCIERSKLKEMLAKGDVKFYGGIPSDTTLSLYLSEDYKLFASKKNKKNTLVYPFNKRYVDLIGLYGAADFGNRLLSCDSISKGKDWICAFEYTETNELAGKIIRIHIESSKGKMGIRTDPEHRETAIGLMNAFTKELMNVTLNLKTWRK